MALLHFLKQAGNKVIAAHLDHGLRGRDSVNDSRFVRKMCSRNRIKLVSGRADVKKTAKKLGISIEEAGRLRRYDFLEKAAKRYRAYRIALAHHADDNIETFLMRAIRGAGIKGLCGIPPVRGNIIRPFIEAFRSEIMDYCKRQGLGYRLDRTNLENKFTRNRIRNLIIPMLEKNDPAVKKRIISLIKGFSRDYAMLSRYVSSISAKLIKRTKQGVLVNRYGLSRVPEELRGYILREAIEMFKGDLVNITSVHVSSALSLKKGYVCLPEEVFVAIEGDSYLITSRSKNTDRPSGFKYRLKVPGTIRLKETGIFMKVSITKVPKDVKHCRPTVAYIDIKKLKGARLFVRNFVPGDRFMPLGMKNLKKLQDFFVDSKIPVKDRYLVPVVCDAEKIIWIAGSRMDERVKLEPSSKRALKIEILC